MKKLILPSLLTVAFSCSLFTLNQDVFAQEQKQDIGAKKAERDLYQLELKVPNLYIQQDRYFDPFDKWIGVEATDQIDGDLTDQIEVIYNNVDTSIPGVYKVTYKVENSRNEVVKKTIEVNVQMDDTWQNGQTSGWKMFSGHDVQLQHNPNEALVSDYMFYSDSHASLYKHYTGNAALEKGEEYRVTIYVKPQNGKPETNRIKVSLKEDSASKDSRELMNTFASKDKLAEKGYYRVSKTFKVGENETKPLIVVENFSAGYIGSINISKTVKAPQQAAPVTIKYQRYSNKEELAPSETLVGGIGESYRTKSKYIPEYVVESTSDNTRGTFTDKPQTITYYYSDILSHVKIFGNQETGEVAKQMAKDVEIGLSKQNKKLGYLKGSKLAFEMSVRGWSKGIPESAPIQIGKEIRVHGNSKYEYSRGSFYLGLYGKNSSIERLTIGNIDKNIGGLAQSSCGYFAEQWDSKNEKWHKLGKEFRFGGEAEYNINFENYYEVAPNLKIKSKNEVVEVQKGSTFNFKPEDFYTELDSAGGTRAKFVTTPDFSKVGEQVVRVRIWDQYVTFMGWDIIEHFDEEDWEQPKNNIVDKDHAAALDVKFKVVEKK